MRVPWTLPVAAAILVLTIPACQQPTAERIVDQAAGAMMVSGDIDDLTTLRIRTVFPDHDYPVVTEIRRPNRIRTEGVDNYVLVFDGERAAFLQQPPAEDGTPQGPALIDSVYLRDLELDIAFVFPAFFDFPSEYLGVESVDDVETHVLRVVLPLGIPVTYFIDAETWLPLKVVADVMVDGTELHPERIFSDYEDMGGVLYARTYRYFWMPEAVDTATVESVEINVPLADDRFAVPDSLDVFISETMEVSSTVDSAGGT